MTRIRPVDPREVHVDPIRFQFKRGGDKYGVTGSLSDVHRWHPALAGTILVWRDWNQVGWIVDGHQRRDLALRAKHYGQPGVVLHAVEYEEAKGITAETVRTIGALKNAAEAGESTDALDIARLLRHGGVDMGEEFGLFFPKHRKCWRHGEAVAALSEYEWNLVFSRGINPELAGEAVLTITDEAQRRAALEYLARNAAAGMSSAQAVVAAVASAGFEESGLNLFGADATALIQRRADVLEAALSIVRTERRAFRAALRHAQRLEAAGNVLDGDTNAERAEGANALVRLLPRLCAVSGPYGEALGRAAARVGAGASVEDAARGFLAEVDAVLRAGERPAMAA